MFSKHQLVECSIACFEIDLTRLIRHSVTRNVTQS
jgi:hypothetical protein